MSANKYLGLSHKPHCSLKVHNKSGNYRRYISFKNANKARKYAILASASRQFQHEASLEPSASDSFVDRSVGPFKDRTTLHTPSLYCPSGLTTSSESRSAIAPSFLAGHPPTATRQLWQSLFALYSHCTADPAIH